jgi:class 3 adenylate cyclase
MNCTSCGHANPEAARFCNACGAPCAPRCARCAAENPPGARFCNACGGALVAPPAESETRKVVTIVFADLIGSTSLHERLDAESARHVMDRYYAALRCAVEAHSGTVVKPLGDGVMAAFGVPRVAEDDALRAVSAAMAMQEAFRTLAGHAGGVGLRVAVNTGEVVVSADNADVVGDPANVAARLQQEARDGEVLVGESTRRLVQEWVTLAPAGVFALKGRAEPVAAYRVVSLELDRDQYLQGARLTWDMRLSRLSSSVIATRGDRLVLQSDPRAQPISVARRPSPSAAATRVPSLDHSVVEAPVACNASAAAS